MSKPKHAHIHIRLVELERGKSYETHLSNLLAVRLRSSVDSVVVCKIGRAHV